MNSKAKNKNQHVMKITTKNLTAAATLLLSFGSLTVNAQDVTPTTTDVELFCEGSDLELGAAPAGRIWMVRYSTTPGNDTPEETLTIRSEEHTSELKSLMSISYAFSC